MTEFDALHNLLIHRRQLQQADCQRQRERTVERAVVAIHEAGHAVVSLALGGRLAMVTADPRLCKAADAIQDAGLGDEWEYAGFCLTLPRSRKRCMATLVAGQLAEEAFGVERSWLDSSDAAALRALAAEKGHAERDALTAARLIARPVVTRYRSGIGLVAAALFERGILSGPDVRELVELASPKPRRAA